VTAFERPEWESLLRAVVAAPADDVPRLVAADWLDEHDQPERAEFIRVQVELARLEAAGRGGWEEAHLLRRRERTFLAPTSLTRAMWALEACPQLVRVEFREQATAPLEAMQVSGADRLTFRRGFVEIVSCTPEEWTQHGAAVRERQPIRAVYLTDHHHLSPPQWFEMLPALAGLSMVRLAYADWQLRTGAQQIDWLRERLPGTEVHPIPLR
jgi:uncharacterized protein (TIGR02996 family)